MNLVLPGGSGQVGTILARAFHAAGQDVVVLSRRISNAVPWKVVVWDGETVGSWAKEFDGADAVINLAGRSVNCRYTAKNRRDILDSRVKSTWAVGSAIRQVANPPRLWLQASTATIYAHRYEADNDETTGILGGSEPEVPDTWRFSIDVTKAWEAAANDCDTPHTRKVLLRSAMTMSPDRGGVFDAFLWLVRRGLGGRVGHGIQFVSRVHDRDFVRAIEWLIDHEELRGPVNVSSPNPIPNAEFLRTLRQMWGTRLGLPASKGMLALGTWAMRTESELVLKSRRVVPGKLLASGFRFEYPVWAAAARDLCGRWKAV